MLAVHLQSIQEGGKEELPDDVHHQRNLDPLYDLCGVWPGTRLTTMPIHGAGTASAKTPHEGRTQASSEIWSFSGYTLPGGTDG